MEILKVAVWVVAVFGLHFWLLLRTHNAFTQKTDFNRRFLACVAFGAVAALTLGQLYLYLAVGVSVSVTTIFMRNQNESWSRSIVAALCTAGAIALSGELLLIAVRLWRG